MSQYPRMQGISFHPPVIPGLGSSGGFEMQLEARGDATFENLVQATDTLMYYASKRKEIIRFIFGFTSGYPPTLF